MFQDIIAQRDVSRYVIDSLLLTLVGGAFYGFGVGISVGGWQVLYDPIKIPWVLIFTVLLCLPSLYVFSCYSGSRLTLMQTCAVALTATAMVATDSAAQQQLAEQAAVQEQLYAEIGRLTTQVSWLKKKAGVDGLPG